MTQRLTMAMQTLDVLAPPDGDLPATPVSNPSRDLVVHRATDAEKLYLHPERIATWLREGASYPITIELDASNVCNHACSFCSWSSLQESDRSVMSRDFMVKIIDNLAAVGVQGIIWTGGGEPLTNKHTVEMLGYAKSKGLKNGLFTNGALLNGSNMQPILETCEWIRCSVAAGRKEDYFRIQGVNDFERVIARMRELVLMRARLSLPVRLGAMMLLHKTSCDSFVDMVRIARDIGLDFIQGKPNTNYDHETRGTWIQEKNVRLRKSKGDTDAAIDHSVGDFDPLWWNQVVIPLFRQARELQTERFGVFTSQYTEEKYDRASSDLASSCHCHVNNFVTAITADGDVVWCKNLRDRKEFVIGNLRGQTLEEIWASPRRGDVQRSIDARSCASFCQNKKLNRMLNGLKSPPSDTHPDFL